MRTACLFLVAVAGCYQPKIADGTIFCSDDPQPKCPSGLKCGIDGLCYKNPVTSPYGNGKLGSPDLSARTGTLLLHTNTGAITIGSDEIVPAQTPPLILSQGGGPKVTIWSFTTLSVPSGLTVTTSSDSNAAAVLAATDQLSILGDIQLGGSGGRDGGSSEGGTDGPDSSSGGGAGALADGSGGGGGGGYISAGTDGSGSMPGAGGAAYGSGQPTVIFYGSGGGGGSGTTSTAVAGFGGLGGGAIALLGLTVEIGGSVGVRGLDGDPATAGMAGGGGGGAGGSILISGQTVTLGGPAKLIAVGGKGGVGHGGGGSGGDGSPGRINIAAGTFTNNASPANLQPAPDPVDSAALATFPTR